MHSRGCQGAADQRASTLMQGLELGWMGLGISLLLLAAVIGIKAREWWLATRLPAGDVVYADGGAWYRQQETLFAPEYGLAGRPDYLVEKEDGQIVPVEIKSGEAPERPYQGHVLQLAAYCLLVEAEYGRRPEHGILQYKDRAFSIQFSERIEEDLLNVIDEMREEVTAGEVDRSHDSWKRCAGCGHKGHCQQSLV